MTARQAGPGRRSLRVLACTAALLGAACSADQAPEIVPGDTGGTVTTSRTLEPCPPGGPDATTPPAGCLDADGRVVRP